MGVVIAEGNASSALERSVNPEKPVPEILTPEDVAALFRVSESWVHEKCRRRSCDPLPAHRIGRYLRFRRSEVFAWFDRAAEWSAPKKRGRR
jgi:predicted DNA-binding transcriptional regulator AlpA